jgi:hypothetical protein
MRNSPKFKAPFAHVSCHSILLLGSSLPRFVKAKSQKLMAYQPVFQQEKPPQYGSIGHPQIIAVQPTSPAVVLVYSTREVNVHGALIFSILIAIICGIAAPASLCCSIPAVTMAVLAQNVQNGQERALHVRNSYVLTAVALIFGLLCTVGAIIYLIKMENTDNYED